MLQRVQTVYLFIAILIVGCLYLWFPMILAEDSTVVLQRSDLQIVIPIILSLVLAVISIMNFKNRKRQMLLNRLNILLNVVLLGVFAYTLLTLSGETLVSEKGIGALLPIISIVFLVLANKAIQRDEDLVKSVDRLR